MLEVIVTWHTFNFHEHLGSLTSEWFESHHVLTAWNIHEQPLTVSQVGGVTFLMVNKLTYQVASTGNDTRFHSKILTTQGLSLAIAQQK